MARGAFNGLVGGQPNVIYDRLVNWDIANQPITDYGNGTGFFLKKRQSYTTPDMFQTFPTIWRDGFLVTDIYITDTTACEGGSCCMYVYMTSNIKDRYRVVGVDCCDFTNHTLLASGDRCFCDYDKFFVTEGPRIRKDAIDGPPPTFEGNGLAGNLTTNGLILTNDNIVGHSREIEVGDYIFMGDNDSIFCGQTRQVTSVGPRTDIDSLLGGVAGASGYTNYILLDLPFSGTTEYSTSGYAVYEDYGEVVGFVGNGIHTLDGGSCHEEGANDLCGFGVGTDNETVCILGVQEHNGVLSYLNDRGYHFYMGSGFDGFTTNANDSTRIGTHAIDLVSFRNFIVFFGLNRIDTIVFSEDGTSTFKYKLRDNIGLWNKGSHAQFDQGLYFVANDRRIYGTNIKSDGNRFYLEIEEISATIRKELDTLQKDDIVTMSSDESKLYIFIQSRHNETESYPTRTKILIFNKERNIRLVHHVTTEVISGSKWGVFFGGGLYNYCGYEGDGANGNTYKASANIVLYTNDQHNLVDENGNGLNLTQQHSMTEIDLLLGAGKYTSGNTYLEYEIHKGGYRFRRRYSINDESDWIENWNSYFNSGTVPNGQCFFDSLDGCAKFEEKSILDPRTDPCDCAYGKGFAIEDERIGIRNDESRVLSPIRKYNFTPKKEFGDLIKVFFVSDGDDIASFGSIYIQTESNPISKPKQEEFSIGCCDK